MRAELKRFPNLIVLNTFSKAWGSAGIRLGMAFAHPEVVNLFNKVKYPYNVSEPTQREALRLLENSREIDAWVKNILSERGPVMAAFAELPVCETVYPSNANFFLARMTDADRIYRYLVEQGIIVRNRSKIVRCGNCLRVTIGTPQENSRLLAALRSYNIR